MTEKVGGIELTASIDTTGAVQAGKVLAKTADQMAADLARVAAAAEEASKEQDRLAQSAIHLAKAQSQAAAQSEKAASASQNITSKLQSQRDSVDAYINALKVQNETLGLSQSELNAYRLAKLAASDAEQKIAANLQSQIDLYHQNTAAVAAAKAQQLQNKSTVEQMIVALREQSATLGLNARQLILYKAAQAGASAQDKKSIIQSLNQIDAYRRKEEATRKATAALQASTAAQGVAQGSMRSLRGVAGNLGFQLQDIAVQAQMGTSAFTILGQQGSQVASAFGPGGAVVGAVIAVAAAIGGVLFTSLNKTSAEIKEQFIPNVKELKENLDQISKAQASVAILQIREELEPLAGVARSAAAQVEYLTKQIEKYPNNKDVKEWNKELVTQQGVLDAVNQKIIKLNEEQTAFQAVIKRNIEGTQGQQKADKKRIETVADLVAATEMQAKTAGLTQRGIALYVAEQAKASEADIKRINAAYDLIEAQDKLKDANKAGIKEDDAKTKALKSVFNGLSEQYQKLLMTTDAYEEYAAVQQAEAAGATPAQIAAIRSKVKALQEERAAIQDNIDLQNEVSENVKTETEDKKKVTTEFNQVQTGIRGDLETPAQAADRELKERLAVIAEYGAQEALTKEQIRAYEVQAEQAHQKQITEIRKSEEAARASTMQGTLSAFGDMFGNLAEIAKQGGEKTFKQYKMLASAQAAISAALAITNVLANPLIPYPLNIGLAASVGALAAVQIGQIQSQQYSGGRLYGGAVQSGGMYRVTEDGKPEILQQGNQQYLLPGSKGGKVVSNKDMKSGDSSGLNVYVTSSVNVSQIDSSNSQQWIAQYADSISKAVDATARRYGRGQR
jgi:hypothetical protein